MTVPYQCERETAVVQPIITRVWFRMGNEDMQADMVRINGRPVLVLDWGGNPGNARPWVTVELDDSLLEEISSSGPIHYKYHGTVESPTIP
jgi:hypothetical protein